MNQVGSVVLACVVGSGVLAAAVPRASADATAASVKKLYAKGLKLLHNGRVEAAQAVLQQVVAAAPEHVGAHYNLACADARLDDLAAVVAELTWLAQSPDPAAAKKLAKARHDPDFRGMAMAPAVRTVLGLPALDVVTADQLLAYGNRWHGADFGCAAAWYEYTFAKTGAVKRRWYCNDDGEIAPGKGTWKIVDGVLDVVVKGDPEMKFVFGPCGSVDAPDDPPDPDGWVCLVSVKDDEVPLELYPGPNPAE